MATEFCSEKILRNRLGTDSVIPRKKVLIPRVFRVPRKTKFRSSERNYSEKLVFRNRQNNLTNYLSVPQKLSFLALFLKFADAAFSCEVHCYQVAYFRPDSDSAGGKVYFYFCSTERDSELFTLLRNGSERNSKSFVSIFVPRHGIPSIFLFLGMVWNGSERNSKSFAFRGTAGIPSE